MDEVYKYVMENFGLFHHFDSTVIDYGKGKKRPVTIKSSCGDFFTKKEDINPGDVVWKKWKNVKIPFLFDKDESKEIVEFFDNRAVINYDIISSAFYFLTGWNEYVNNGKDRFGRVAYEYSIIKKLGIVETPVVNYYFDILFTALKKVTDVQKINFDDNHDFVTVLTHDIDTCKSAWLEGGLSELKKKRPFGIPYLFFKKITGNDLWMNFQTVSETDLRYGKSSTFFFLSEKGKAGKIKNADYNIKSGNIRKHIAGLIDRGHEIGVHGSAGTHLSAKKLSNDINKTGVNNIIGNRFHFLLFDIVKTVNVLSDANIKYDTTLGFAEHPGFRRGICYPFFLYDFENGKTSNVLEIPLILMDSTLQNKKYMNLKKEDGPDKIKAVIDEIKKFNGVFTILWHNTFFSKYKYGGWKRVYISILDYCNENNSIFTSAKDLYQKTVKTAN
jgi:hypothetical protein